jgi:methyl-accepting chemotaxis protein
MINAVALGAEEPSAPVREISESIVRSCDTKHQAVELAESVDGATQRFVEATKSMGGIVETINSITTEMNLLALNATIESSRAGEPVKVLLLSRMK